jgi:hypothetical protein
MQNYNFTSSFIWEGNLVSHINESTHADIRVEGTEEDILV